MTLSPRTIVTGWTIRYNNHCRYEFGAYVQTYKPHDNTMGSWTIGALALQLTGNKQGSYYFLNLTTGRVVNRNRATTLPILDEVIEQVH
jgi:hypothetical protein